MTDNINQSGQPGPSQGPSDPNQQYQGHPQGAPGPQYQQQPGQFNQGAPGQFNQGAPGQPQGGAGGGMGAGFPAIFSFNFNSPLIERFAAIVFLLGIIALGGEWLMGLFTLIANDFATWAAWLTWIWAAVIVVLKIAVLRIFIEIGMAVVHTARSRS